DNKHDVTMFLVNGIRLQGQIRQFDVNGGSKVGHGAAQNWASGGRFAPWRAR
ncbi:MAG: RNA chaperone Hfq, partial [Microvirga sp.]